MRFTQAAAVCAAASLALLQLPAGARAQDEDGSSSSSFVFSVLQFLGLQTPSFYLMSYAECRDNVAESTIFSDNLLKDSHCTSASVWNGNSDWVFSNVFSNILNLTLPAAGCQLSIQARSTPGNYTIYQDIDLSPYANDIDSQTASFVPGVSAEPALFVTISIGSRSSTQYGFFLEYFKADGTLTDYYQVTADDINNYGPIDEVAFSISEMARKARLVLTIEVPDVTNESTDQEIVNVVSDPQGFSYLNIKYGTSPNTDDLDAQANSMDDFYLAMWIIVLINAVVLPPILLIGRRSWQHAMQPYNSIVYFSSRLYYPAIGILVTQGIVTYNQVTPLKKIFYDPSRPFTALATSFWVLALCIIVGLVHYPLLLASFQSVRYNRRTSVFVGIYASISIFIWVISILASNIMDAIANDSETTGYKNPYYQSKIAVAIIILAPTLLCLLYTIGWFIHRVFVCFKFPSKEYPDVKHILKEDMESEFKKVTELFNRKKVLDVRKQQLEKKKNKQSFFKEMLKERYETFTQAGHQMWTVFTITVCFIYVIVVSLGSTILEKYRYILACYTGIFLSSGDQIQTILNNVGTNNPPVTIDDAVNSANNIATIISNSFLAVIILSLIFTFLIVLENIYGTMRTVNKLRKELTSGKWPKTLASSRKITLQSTLQIVGRMVAFYTGGALFLFIFFALFLLIVFYVCAGLSNSALVRNAVWSILNQSWFYVLISNFVVTFLWGQFVSRVLIKMAFTEGGLRLRSPTQFHLWGAVTMFVTLITSFFAVVVRAILSIFSQLLYTGRIDVNFMVKRFKFLDPNGGFLQFVCADHSYNNYIFLSFCQIQLDIDFAKKAAIAANGANLEAGVTLTVLKPADKPAASSAGKKDKKDKKDDEDRLPNGKVVWHNSKMNARNRWHLMVMMVRNPFLRFERKHYLKELEERYNPDEKEEKSMVAALFAKVLPKKDDDTNSAKDNKDIATSLRVETANLNNNNNNNNKNYSNANNDYAGSRFNVSSSIASDNSNSSPYSSATNLNQPYSPAAPSAFRNSAASSPANPMAPPIPSRQSFAPPVSPKPAFPR